MMGNSERHSEMLELIGDYIKNQTIVYGNCDMRLVDTGFDDTYMMFNNDWWVVAGLLDYDSIMKALNESDYTSGTLGTSNVECEGCYQYKAVIVYYPGSYQEPSECYVDHIEFDFIETIEARDRDIKLNQLLSEKSGSDGLFDF